MASGTFNFGDALTYLIEAIGARSFRTTEAMVNEIEARIALHVSTTAYTPNNPHTGEYRGGQGYI
jgi:hypothetical protein